MKTRKYMDELIATDVAIRSKELLANGDFTNWDKAGSPEAIAQDMLQAFEDIHNYIKQDSSQHNRITEGRHFQFDDTVKALNIQPHFTEFVEALYDDNGQFKATNAKDVSDAMFTLYDEMTTNIPLQGADLALGQLFVEMGRSEKYQAFDDRGVDFTRSDANQSYKDKFLGAIVGEDRSMDEKPFPDLPESFTIIGNTKFMTYESNWEVDEAGKRTPGQINLVTENGRLVELTDGLRNELELFLADGQDLADFNVNLNQVPSNTLASYFQDPEHSDPDKPRFKFEGQLKQNLERLSKKEAIDDRSIEDGNVRVVSMSNDLLTGLSISKSADGKSELDTVKAFLKEQAPQTGISSWLDMIPSTETNVFSLSSGEKEAYFDKVKEQITEQFDTLKNVATAQNTPEITTLLERANRHMNERIQAVIEGADKAFVVENEKGNPVRIKRDPDTNEVVLKQPAAKVATTVDTGSESRNTPHMFAFIGGTGSGKSSMEDFAQKEVAGNAIVATLDGARSESDIYDLYPGTSNHSDDYQIFSEFGNTIRDLTKRKAMEGEYHIIVDGSGVPHKNRNDKMYDEFAESGYYTTQLDANTPFVNRDIEEIATGLDPEKEYESSAVARGVSRFNEIARLAPLEVFFKKHIGHPVGVMDAAKQENVHRSISFDLAGQKGSDYIMRYTVDATEAQIKEIKGANGQEFLNKLDEVGLLPEWTKEKLPKNPNDHVSDFKVVLDRAGDETSYRMEVILNMNALLASRQKGLLDLDAAKKKDLSGVQKNTTVNDIEQRFANPDEPERVKRRKPKQVSTMQLNSKPVNEKVGGSRPQDEERSR